jgi:hypothetical protein
MRMKLAVPILLVAGFVAASCGSESGMSQTDEQILQKKLSAPLGAPNQAPKAANPKAAQLRGAGTTPATGG